MNKWTNIRISRELHAKLVTRGKKSETFDETITRLIDYEKNEGVQQ